MTRRGLLFVLGGAFAGATGLVAAFYRPFPSDKTPEGAYMRLARAFADDRPRDAFAYLETEAQWACFTLRDMRKKALSKVEKSYPAAERDELVRLFRSDAEASDGGDVFANVVARRGWRARLRKDLSGVVRAEIDGDRATIVTARGTRYPFRRRDNGIWGLTIFTADLLAEAERASRDLVTVEAAADDYERKKPR